MKLNSAWWLLTAVGLGFVVSASATGCGPDDKPIPGAGGSAGGTTSSSSSTGAGGGSGGGPVKGDGDVLAVPCSEDAECADIGEGAICVKATGADPVFQGGPSDGYCSKPCQTSGDCPGLTNICFKPMGAAEGRCVLGCELGPELNYLNDPLDEFKCHAREDVACYRIAAGDVCLPTCTNDTACPADRYCNLAAGVCLDKTNLPTGKKLGMTCNPMAAPDECGNGFCIGSGMGKGFCSGVCTLGGDALGMPNMAATDCGGLENGLCLFLPVVDGCPPDQSCVGAGDVGFCGGGCKSHDDCGAADAGDLWCANLNAMLFPVGYCVNAKACPLGTECTINDGKCTDTKVGKYCLDDYPLGERAPGGGGAGGGMMMDAGADGAGGAGGGMMDAGMDGG